MTETLEALANARDAMGRAADILDGHLLPHEAGLLRHAADQCRSALAAQSVPEAGKAVVKPLEQFHKEVWGWLRSRDLVDPHDDEWPGFKYVIEEHEAEIEAAANQRADKAEAETTSLRRKLEEHRKALENAEHWLQRVAEHDPKTPGLHFTSYEDLLESALGQAKFARESVSEALRALSQERGSDER